MSLGPLTSIFTPEASCGGFWQYYWDWYGPPLLGIGCYPPNYRANASSFYSPGRCPTGYTPATNVVNTYVATVTETTQTCCPTGLSFSAIPTPPDRSSQPVCFSEYISDGTVMMTSKGNDGALTSREVSTTSGFGVYAWGVIVRFQPTDFQSTSLASATVGVTVDSPTATNTAALKSSLTSEAKSTRRFQGLSTMVVIFITCFMSFVAAK